MTDTKAAAEPSMEEILASIRQIINQPDAAAEGEAAQPSEDSIMLNAPEGEEDPADIAPEDDDVMELTSILEEDSMAVVEPEPEAEKAAEEVVASFSLPEEAAPAIAPVPEPLAVAAVEPAPTPAPAPSFAAPAYAPPPAAPTAASVSDLIVGQTAAAATAALSGLANSVYQDRAENSLPLGNHTRTLESMVVEAIKPLLKEWCDEHLPSIVERVVAAEVEKLTKRIGG